MTADELDAIAERNRTAAATERPARHETELQRAEACLRRIFNENVELRSHVIKLTDLLAAVRQQIELANEFEARNRLSEDMAFANIEELMRMGRHPVALCGDPQCRYPHFNPNDKACWKCGRPLYEKEEL